MTRSADTMPATAATSGITNQNPATPQAGPDRRPDYEPPRLIRYGSVLELTAGTGGSLGDGLFPVGRTP